MTTQVNLISLACAAVASSIIASKPIRRIALEDDTKEELNGVGARIKPDGTIVTHADGASQRIIVENIRRICNEIRIVGEESKEDVMNGSDYYNEDEDLFDEEIYTLVREDVHSRINEVKEEIDADRVSVFIDPLDGTKNYANKRYDSVTILIAIVVDNTPLFGVVCKPFGILENCQNCINQNFSNTGCFVIYGGTLLKGAYIAGAGTCQPNQKSDTDTVYGTIYKAVISKSRSKGIVQQCLQKLHARLSGLVEEEPLYISGAGEKTLRLILANNHESLWFFPKPGTSLWDVAAADALLTAVGGRLTDKYGNRIDYSKNRLDADNALGVVACNNLYLHEQCILTFREEGPWDDT